MRTPGLGRGGAADNGYGKTIRDMATTAGDRGYLSIERDEAPNRRRANRSSQDGEEERKYNRLAGQSSWLKGLEKGANKEEKSGKTRGQREEEDQYSKLTQ